MTGFLRRPRCGHDPPAQAVLSPLSVLRPCGGYTLRLRPSPRPPPRPLGDAAAATRRCCGPCSSPCLALHPSAWPIFSIRRSSQTERVPRCSSPCLALHTSAWPRSQLVHGWRHLRP